MAISGVAKFLISKSIEWPLYKRYDFSIRHPQNWIVVENKIMNEDVICFSNFRDNCINQQGELVRIWINPITGISPGEFDNGMINQMQKWTEDKGFKHIKKINLGNHDTDLFRYRYGDSCVFRSGLTKGNKTYNIIYKTDNLSCNFSSSIGGRVIRSFKLF